MDYLKMTPQQQADTIEGMAKELKELKECIGWIEELLPASRSKADDNVQDKIINKLVEWAENE